ncbi:putative F-box domain-containing protein [Neospora caninum Liverpool]|nr:putative F-box domain-containing protein [Neospora caninum Liverpool]CBZ50241.1 putative F-box domain-containing protein [Neospora caninum Liverpool]|eukprot:XP_003880276.1 putative F-box domain-containing protein [Neospora caninum Liverpool]
MREREASEAAAARAAAEEICFVEMEAAMRLGRDRAALSLQRQECPGRREPAQKTPEAEARLPQPRGDARNSLFSLAASPPPRAVAALLTHYHVQRLQRLHALRDQQSLLERQREGRQWGEKLHAFGERGHPRVQLAWSSSLQRQVRGSAAVRRPGRGCAGEAARGGQVGNATASGFSLSDYLFFAEDGDEPSGTKEAEGPTRAECKTLAAQGVPAEARETVAREDTGDRGESGVCRDGQASVSSIPATGTVPLSRPAGGDSGAAEPVRDGKRNLAPAGDRPEKPESAEEGAASGERGAEAPRGREKLAMEAGASEVERGTAQVATKGGEEPEMDEDQFLDFLFGPGTSSCSTSSSPRHDQEGASSARRSTPLSPSAASRTQSVSRSSSPAAEGCGGPAGAEDDALLSRPAQLAAQRFAATPPASLSEALRLWQTAWRDSAAFAARQPAGEAPAAKRRSAGARMAAHAEEKESVRLSEANRGAAAHVCHGRSCDIWSIPQFELYLCRDSGAFHCCGIRCDRMVASDCDVGFLVCPVSGLMVDPALINAWTARERQSSRAALAPTNGDSRWAPADVAALLDFAGSRSKESDALRLRSAELMNELVVATYVSEQQAGAEDDDEMAGIGGMFGRFWTAGYLAENEGELLRPKKRCKYT